MCVIQEASPADINMLSPEPDDDEDDEEEEEDEDEVNNNDIDDDRPSYATSPLNSTGGFVELSMPDLSQDDASEAFNSTASLTDSFYSQWSIHH